MIENTDYINKLKYLITQTDREIIRLESKKCTLQLALNEYEKLVYLK